MESQDMILLSGNANHPLAQRICEYLGITLGRADITRFADGEINVDIKDNVRGRDVFLLQSTCSPVNDHLMELLIMTDACKRASAGRITAVLPYYGYARQDRKLYSRAPITSKLVADMLTVAGISRVLTMDLHAGQIQGFFNVPVDNLYATYLLCNHIEQTLFKDNPLMRNNLVIVSPDSGGVERARVYASRLGASLAIIDKRRPAPNVSHVLHVVGDVKDKIAIIVDDMVDTGGTLCGAVQGLLERGATEVYACCTHPVLSPPAIERVENSGMKSLIVTDTIPLSPISQACSKIQVVSVDSVLAEAINAIHNNLSISKLFANKTES